MSTSKRASTIPTGPKPPTSISTGAVISDAAIIVGTYRVTIGSNTILHPRSKIDATHGPVTIGNFCIICERSVVGLASPESTTARPGEAESVLDIGVTLGSGVSVEPGAVVEAREIGDGCVVEANARIGQGAILGKHCKIGPLLHLKPAEYVPDLTVIYGAGTRRKDRSGTEGQRMATMKRHADMLAKLIPSNVTKWQ